MYWTETLDGSEGKYEFYFLPVVSKVRRYATIVHTVLAQREGNAFANSVTGLSID